ncbi:MAG: sugar phosphate nucleotidyltransferase [Nanoarchaeota archaeon]
MKIIIPLAGVGTRLRPHTYSKPKPLLHVAGKPVLGHILDKVKEELPEVNEIIFITGHLKEKIEEYVTTNYDFSCTFVEQHIKDGTAGAVKLAEPYVDEPVLIIFVDTIFDADLGEIKKADKEGIDGIIWVKEVEDYQRFGVVLHKNWFMTKSVEKPSEPISKLANIGLYYISDFKSLFKKIHVLYEKNIKTKGEYYLTDAFELMIQDKAKIKVIEVDGWYDCGKKETLLETNRILLQKLDEQNKGKKVEEIQSNEHIKIENSVIIPPVSIEEGVKIKNSIIGPYVSIAKDAEIDHCIIQDSIINEKASLSYIELSESIIGEQAIVSDSTKKLNVGDHSEINIKNENYP